MQRNKDVKICLFNGFPSKYHYKTLEKNVQDVNSVTSPFVVKDHNFMRCALHLQQARLVNNPGFSELFIKIADRINIIPTII